MAPGLYTRRSGPREAASRGSIAFIHGFPFDGSMWDPQLETLPDGWRGLAPDLRGFGQSELRAVRGEVSSGMKAGGRIARPHEAVLTMDRMADDVAALLEVEATGPAVVCGLSMGGYVAFSLVRRHRSLVRALVLADTRPDADTDEGRENRMRLAQTAREGGARPVARALLPGLLAERTFERRPEVAERVRAMVEATRTDTIIAALAGMAARRDASPDLPALDLPTLVLVGEHDALTPPDVARAMADRLPAARFIQIPEAGHVANLENPAAFDAALAEFLGGL